MYLAFKLFDTKFLKKDILFNIYVASKFGIHLGPNFVKWKGNSENKLILKMI